MLRIIVSDTGLGIPPERLSRVFTPFHRWGAEQTSTQGTGLGLALANSLTEAMGGTLGAESVPNRGSRFWVELPLVEQVARFEWEGRPVTSRHLNTSTGSQLVLYIESNISNLHLVERIFSRRSDLRIMPAMQGRLGLELAREHQPDLILLNVHLPDFLGYEVLEELEAVPELRDIPVIVVSADATPKQVERLLDGGAPDYFTKPFDVSRLLTAIDQALGRSSDQA